MILYGQKLVDTLRKLCDNSKERIWIVTPFIGYWGAIEKILGRKWMTNYDIDLKILTDIRNELFINYESFEKFKHRAEIRTLRGLHAKIYLIDNSALITSANLTGTAFTKRYEMGYLCYKVPPELESAIIDWWNNSSKVDSSWTPPDITKNRSREEGNTKGLKKHWNFPQDDIKTKTFKNFGDYLKAHDHFKQIYSQLTPRILNFLPIYHEIDSFFNYLFHEHPKKPTKKYLKRSYRKITDQKRKTEISRYIKQYKNWINENPGDENYRNKRIKTVQEKLSKKNIEDISIKNIEKVIDSLHCMNSLVLNKKRFLNPRNNTIDMIINEWKKLLHSRKLTIEGRMEECNNNLNYFGKSAIQELIAWYYPDKYSVINRNSNSGLKFFGYNVKTY